MIHAGITRRQAVAGGLGLVGSLLTGNALRHAWGLLAREDLVPGEPPDLQLRQDPPAPSRDMVAFAAIGDNGSGGRQAVEVAEAMARSYEAAPFGSVSLLGDICYYGPISERFDEVFLRPMKPLIDVGVEFELAVGNHDGPLFLDEGVPDVEETLDLLGTPARYYAVRRGPVDFFYLDSGSIVDGGGGEQLEWLDTALARAEAPWRIVCSHHPLYSSGVHGNTDRVRELLEPLLSRHQVDVVLAGHDHHYERTVPIDGITHIVSGGGCKLTPVEPRSFTEVATSTLQFMRFDVERGELTGRCLGVDGDEIDRFELRSRRSVA